MKKALILLLIVVLILVMFDVAYQIIEYPERFFPTWRYQLRNDIARGNEEAKQYYEKHYASKGIKLFDE